MPDENRDMAKKISERKGQSMIEAMVAIFLLTTGFLSVFALLGRSLSLNRFSSESYTATYLAGEGIEVARNLIDANGIQRLAWNSGFADGDYELQYDSTSLSSNQGRFISYEPATHIYAYGGSVQTPFKRLIRIASFGTTGLRINSIVSWSGPGGGSFNVNLEDHFLSWRVINH